MLITLAIIGVVGAMTIPALINSYQTQVYITKYKKAFSTLNQAAARVMDDNGGDFMNVCTGTYGNPMGSDCLKNKFASYLNVAKSCPVGSILDNCWSSDFYMSDGTTAWYGAWITDITGSHSAVILSDGTFITFEERSTTCSESFTNLEGDTKYRCGQIFIDTNGFKPPNAFGKDIFYLHIVSDKLVPVGAIGYKRSDAQTCPQTAAITSCAADYLGK